MSLMSPLSNLAHHLMIHQNPSKQKISINTPLPFISVGVAFAVIGRGSAQPPKAGYPAHSPPPSDLKAMPPPLDLVSDPDLPQWWLDANHWLDKHCEAAFGCYFVYLAVAYAILAIVALVQLIRIQVRVPEFGWTTQKVFHLMNLFLCVIRAVSFALYTYKDDLQKVTNYQTIELIIFDLPALLFFTAYTLLVLFWAEIFHQASMDDTSHLRPWFCRINISIYLIATILWALTLFDFAKHPFLWARMASAGFLALVSLLAVVAFLVYGCRLFAMLRQFPIESGGRKRKLQEVGFITFIGSFCFAIRAVLCSTIMILPGDMDFDIDLLGDPLLNIVFYLVCEILVVASVLIILHRIPPKRQTGAGVDEQMYDALPDRAVPQM